MHNKGGGRIKRGAAASKSVAEDAGETKPDERDEDVIKPDGLGLEEARRPRRLPR